MKWFSWGVFIDLGVDSQAAWSWSWRWVIHLHVLGSVKSGSSSQLKTTALSSTKSGHHAPPADKLFSDEFRLIEIILSTKNQNHSRPHLCLSVCLSVSLSLSLSLARSQSPSHAHTYRDTFRWLLSGDLQQQVDERWEENEKAWLAIMLDSYLDRFSDLLCSKGSKMRVSKVLVEHRF